MKVTPKTEKEIAEANLLKIGIYDAEVIKAEDTMSKAGNDMIALTLRVFGEDVAVLVNDFLLDAIAYKVRHAAEAMGLLSDYETGHLTASDMMGKTVRVRIAIQKDKNGQYPDRNGVADYVVDKSARSASVPHAASRREEPPPPDDADIPF